MKLIMVWSISIFFWMDSLCFQCSSFDSSHDYRWRWLKNSWGPIYVLKKEFFFVTVNNFYYVISQTPFLRPQKLFFSVFMEVKSRFNGWYRAKKTFVYQIQYIFESREDRMYFLAYQVLDQVKIRSFEFSYKARKQNIDLLLISRLANYKFINI